VTRFATCATPNLQNECVRERSYGGPGLLRRGSDGIELAPRLSPGPCSMYLQLRIDSENSSFRNTIGMSSALEALRDALYKSTNAAAAAAAITSLEIWSGV